MKLIFKMAVLALLLYSCNCADDNRTDYDPAAISGSWKLAQRISEGAITIYNNNHYKHLRFNIDSTYPVMKLLPVRFMTEQVFIHYRKAN